MTNIQPQTNAVRRVTELCENCVGKGEIPISKNSKFKFPESILNIEHRFNQNAVCKDCGLSVELINEEMYPCKTICKTCNGRVWCQNWKNDAKKKLLTS